MNAATARSSAGCRATCPRRRPCPPPGARGRRARCPARAAARGQDRLGLQLPRDLAGAQQAAGVERVALAVAARAAAVVDQERDVRVAVGAAAADLEQVGRRRAAAADERRGERREAAPRHAAIAPARTSRQVVRSSPGSSSGTGRRPVDAGGLPAHGDREARLGPRSRSSQPSAQGPTLRSNASRPASCHVLGAAAASRGASRWRRARAWRPRSEAEVDVVAQHRRRLAAAVADHRPARAPRHASSRCAPPPGARRAPSLGDPGARRHARGARRPAPAPAASRSRRAGRDPPRHGDVAQPAGHRPAEAPSPARGAGRRRGSRAGPWRREPAVGRHTSTQGRQVERPPPAARRPPQGPAPRGVRRGRAALERRLLHSMKLYARSHVVV